MWKKGKSLFGFFLLDKVLQKHKQYLNYLFHLLHYDFDRKKA